MKANIRKIEYMVVQPHTYLVAELEPGARTVGFCLEMAERCRIPGLLPLHRQMVDGGVRLCYDITGKKRLADLAAEMSLSEDGVLRLVRNLLEGLAGLPEYFLRTTQCLLEEDYTYADSTLAVYLPLAPMEDDPADGDALLRDYLIRLLGSCTSAGRTGPRLNELAACLIRPDFSVPGLLDKVRALSAGQTPAQPAPAPAWQAAPVTAQPRPDPAPVPPVTPVPQPAAPAPVPETPDKKKNALGGLFGHKEKAEKPAPAPVIPGFAVPGMAAPAPKPKEEKAAPAFAVPGGAGKPFAVPGAPAPAQPAAPEKKKGGLGGLFGHKEKPAKTPVVEMNKERHMGGQDRIPPAAPVPPAPAPAAQPVQPQPAAWQGTTLLQQTKPGGGATVLMGAQAAGAPALTLTGAGQAVRVDRFPFTVGRYECDMLLDAPTVSKKHLSLLHQNGMFYVQDENSSNYTYLDGQIIPPYTPVPLPASCELRLGSVVLLVKAE